MIDRREAVADAIQAASTRHIFIRDDLLRIADAAIAAMDALPIVDTIDFGPLDGVPSTAEPTCPECNGDGEIQHLQAWDIPGATQKCPTCRGTGTAPTEPTIDDVLLAAAAIDARLPGLSDAFPDDPDDDLPLMLAHLALSAAREADQP